LREYLVSSTAINDDWTEWGEISQVTINGNILKISDVAQKIVEVAGWIGPDVEPAMRIQKFIEAIHPKLRVIVGPLI
jgi:hypothetical protein